MEIREFILEKLKENNYEHLKLYDLYGEFKKVTKSKGNLKSYKKYISEIVQELLLETPEDSEVYEAIKVAKDHQKLQDKLRVSRKIAREDFRVYNFLEEKNDKIIELLEGINLTISKTKNHNVKEEEALAVLQISDTHFGESIDLPHNKFNMEVASKRLKKLATKTKNYLKVYNIKNLLITLVGDLINHDHVLDKEILNIDHKTKAMLQTVYVLEQMILDLNTEANITVASVVGNESRKHEYMPNDPRLVTHSYDYDIHMFLKVIFKDKEGITFLDGDFSETVVKVFNSNILLLHGDKLKGNYEKSIQALLARHSVNGNKIRFILVGHIHNHIITPYMSRVSGLPGVNSYSENLNLYGRAGQNLHFIFKDESIESINIDLQNIDSYEAYNVEERLVSNKEIKDESTKETILKIVI